MTQSNIIVGAGAGIVGLMLGFIVGSPDTGKLMKDVSKQVSASAEKAGAAGAEQMAAMDTRIANLEQALSASQEGMSAKMDEAVASLSARMDTMTTDLGEAVAASSSAQAENVQTALDASVEKLQGSISKISIAAAATAAAEDTELPAVAAAPSAPVEIEGAKVGQTEVLMDGEVRVFVSSVNRDDKTARVAVNGLNLQKVGSYHDAVFMLGEKSCTLLLDDIVQDHVQMSATCDE